MPTLDEILRSLPASPPRDPLDGSHAKDPLDASHADDGLLLALQAGTLGEAAAADLEGHLAACADCRALAAELAVPVPETVVSRAVEAGRTRLASSSPSARPSIPQGRARYFGAAAAAAGLLLGTYLVVRQGAVDSGPAVSGFVVTGPFGGLVESRGPSAPPSPVFTADATLTLRISPPAGAAADVHPRLYRLGADDRLVAIAGVVDEVGPTGLRRLTVSAASALGSGSGSKRLFVVIGGAEIDGIDGQSLSAARALAPKAQWVDYTVESR